MKKDKTLHVPDTLQVESRRKIVLSGVLILLIFVGGFGIWSVTAKTSGAVIAQGNVRVDLNRKTVQHRDGGIVQEILVRDGDFVEAEQPLVILKDTKVEANVDLLESQLFLWRARTFRLQAQQASSSELLWPEHLLSVPGDEAANILKSEGDIFYSEHETLEGQVALLRNQIEQIQQQIVGLQAQVAAEDRIIAAYSEELKAKEALERARFLEKTPIFELRRNIADREARKSTAWQNIAQARERIAELELRIVELRKEYVQRATTQHAEALARVFETQERLRPMVDALNLLVVRAPVSGIVMDLQVFTIGAVIRPGDKLMDVVPRESPLIVEAQVQTKDIANVHIGQHARIQLSAFSQREVTPVGGTVVYVSPDSTLTRTPYGEMPVFMVHAEIEPEDLQQQGLTLSPGMPATVFITTKERTLFEYIVDPLTQNFRKALRES